jgi:hypothetical protein
MLTAIVALKQAPDHNTRWPWLAPNGFDNISSVHFPRRVVLSELGRVDNPEAICDLADQLCTGEFKATEAVRRIRAWRLDQPILPPADARELQGILSKAVDEYYRTHDEMSPEDVWRACEGVMEEWNDKDDDADE